MISILLQNNSTSYRKETPCPTEKWPHVLHQDYLYPKTNRSLSYGKKTPILQFYKKVTLCPSERWPPCATSKWPFYYRKMVVSMKNDMLKSWVHATDTSILLSQCLSNIMTMWRLTSDSDLCSISSTLTPSPLAAALTNSSLTSPDTWVSNSFFRRALKRSAGDWLQINYWSHLMLKIYNI